MEKDTSQPPASAGAAPIQDAAATEVEELAEVQDAAREQQMRRRFGLRRSGEGRGGTDAVDDAGNAFELKSGTTNQITTGRDLGPHTLERYRTRYWLICKGINKPTGFEMQECLFATPTMMEWWISRISEKLAPDVSLLQKVLDIVRAAGMPANLIKRAEYLLRRGMTLNNPKINFNRAKAHGKPIDMSRDLPSQLRELVKTYPLGGGVQAEEAPVDKDGSSRAP